MPSILSRDVAAIWERSRQNSGDHVAFATYLFDTAEALLRLVQGTRANNRIMMTMVLAILQDYDEVMAVWTLGLGDAAIKLARPLYEKALTFAYLARSPDEIKDFTDYSSVHWHKILDEGAVASPEGKSWVTPETREQIEREYAAVRDRYRMPASA